MCFFVKWINFDRGRYSYHLQAYALTVPDIYPTLPLSFNKLIHLQGIDIFVTALSAAEFLDVNSDFLYSAIGAACDPKLFTR